MDIRPDDLSGPEIQALLAEHLKSMYAISPAESVHALDLEGLRGPGISFWTVWEHGELLGCGALKQIDARHGEVKSMRTAASQHRKGVARTMLAHIVGEARRRGCERLSLETGSQDAFEPARRLYESFGFGYTGPFDQYVEDPSSVFMTLELRERADPPATTPGVPGRRQTLDDVLNGEGPSERFLDEFNELRAVAPASDEELERQALEHPGADGDRRTPE